MYESDENGIIDITLPSKMVATAVKIVPEIVDDEVETINIDSVGCFSCFPEEVSVVSTSTTGVTTTEKTTTKFTSAGTVVTTVITTTAPVTTTSTCTESESGCLIIRALCQLILMS
mgnify:CR=1